MEEKIRLFIYGNLKSEHAHHALLGDSLFVCEASLRGELRAMPEGFPALIDGEGDVWGEVYQVSPDLLKRLDLEEESVPGESASLYRRTDMVLPLGDGMLGSCAVYWYADEEDARRRGTLVPNGCW